MNDIIVIHDRDKSGDGIHGEWVCTSGHCTESFQTRNSLRKYAFAYLQNTGQGFCWDCVDAFVAEVNRVPNRKVLVLECRQKSPRTRELAHRLIMLLLKNHNVKVMSSMEYHTRRWR